MQLSNKIVNILDAIAEWSLYVMIFALPFSKSLVEITIVTALSGVIIKKLITKERFVENTHIEILLYIFLIASAISLFNSPYMKISVRALFSKSLKFAALFLVAKEIINTRQKLDRFIMVSLASCAVILADGFIQYFITHVDLLHNYPTFKYVKEELPFLGFPTASFPFPNDFAAWMLIFIFPIGVFVSLGNGGLVSRVICGLLFTGLLYSLVLTKVRGAWLSFMASFAILTIIRSRKIVVFLIIVLLLTAVFVKKDLMSDIVSLSSIGDRVTMWRNGWEIFKKHPVIGNGVNTFFGMYAEVRNDEFRGKKGSYAHNCYLQMAADIGLVGLASFLFFIAALILKGFKAFRRTGDPFYSSVILGMSLGLIAFLLHSFVDTNLYSLNLAALFWLSAGMLLATVKIAEAAK